MNTQNLYDVFTSLHQIPHSQRDQLQSRPPALHLLLHHPPHHRSEVVGSVSARER